jgi:hypothetical protein
MVSEKQAKKGNNQWSRYPRSKSEIVNVSKRYAMANMITRANNSSEKILSKKYGRLEVQTCPS